MPHHWRLFHDLHAAQGVLVCGKFLKDFDDIIGMRLGVDAPGHGESHQVHPGRFLRAIGLASEHHRADFAAPDAAHFVEGAGQCLAGIFQRRNVGQEGARVDEHGMATCWFHDGNAHRIQPFGNVCIRPHTIAQVILVDDLAEALRDGVEIASGQAAIGREAFRLNQQGAGAFGKVVIIHGQPAANVCEGVFLGAHRHAVGHGESIAYNVLDAAVFLAVFAKLDEPGILGKAAAVDEEWLAMSMGNLCRAANVFQAHRLAAACIVGDGHHHCGHGIALFLQQGFQRIKIHIALERMV